MPGRDLLSDEPGLDEVIAGLSGLKKLDFRLPVDGDGGIWESVSIVRSDKEGLDLRGSVRAVCGESVLVTCTGPTSVLVSAEKHVSARCDKVLAALDAVLPNGVTF